MGATSDEIERAIAAHEESLSSQGYALNGEIGTFGPADYYSYCEEGRSGLMVWTNNSPSNCYG
ncbi:hypothetical protein [Jonesia quinghaiensis]|uniref:hypothetical protein n=1 Tax=Jonesia quinghaiensis TaxID=262806 RepID=UPI0012F712E7|nr:hypothetical protein [Jonesia quinghaiensis]